MLDLGVNGKKADWKENLSVEAEQELNELLESIRKHKCAYRAAENVQVAQVWCGLVEMKRTMNKLEDRLQYIEKVLRGMFTTHDEEKDKLIKSLVKF